MIKKSHLIFALVFFIPFILNSQFQNDSLKKKNFIENKKEISSFYNKLRKLQNDSLFKVNVLHIGDSHIQPNNFTGKIRELLQLKYGNGGRGLVFPYQFASTLGPKDYTFSSSTTWKNSWIIHQQKKFPIGLVGIGVCASKNVGGFECRLGSDSLPFNFSKYTLFYSFLGNEGEVKNRLGYSKKYDSSKDFDTIQGFSQVPSYRINFDFKGTLNLHGLYLENSQKGVVYSSLGVAGARYVDYLNNELFFQEIPLLKLDLIIVSLGTNEAYANSFDSLNFFKNSDAFINRIKKQLPHTDILLTLPSEHYKFRDSLAFINPNVFKVHEILRILSEKYNCAVWDLYSAMGGAGSMLEWKKEKLVNPDLLHFYKKGYQLQGELFYNALINN